MIDLYLPQICHSLVHSTLRTGGYEFAAPSPLSEKLAQLIMCMTCGIVGIAVTCCIYLV